MRLYYFALCLTFCLLPLRADFDQSPAARTLRTLPYTTQLIMPNHAEVDHLTIDQAGHITGITGTRPLPQDEAVKLATMWRGLTYGFHYSSGCHLPGFAVRFYQDKKLIAEETICFTCGSILFRKTDVLENLSNPGWQGFDRRDLAATHLLTFLKSLFPEVFSTTS